MTFGPPEARVRRDDLVPGSRPCPPRRVLLSIVHVTDMHVVDAQSPGRYEFMERLYGGPQVLHVVLPAYRPQECLHLHACEAMIRTINRIDRSPVTGSPIHLLVSTGDNIDNAQRNELHWFLQLMQGETLNPASGGVSYEGVQAPDWDDRAYWHPDSVPDDFKTDTGFPIIPGLLDDAVRPFRPEGLHLPWISCYGNHDAFILGAARANHVIESVFVGSSKAQSSPEGFIPDHLSEFIPYPEHFLGPPFRTVTPNRARELCGRNEYMKGHVETGGDPPGHGFSHGRLFYVHDDIPHVRLIMLDTTNAAGDFPGSLGAGQSRWLEDRLIDVHSRYFDRANTEVRTGNDDRLVLICAHNPLASLTNDRSAPEGLPGRDEPRLLSSDVEALVHRFPNVVLWLAGHTHQHHIRPHPDPTGRTSGFWEVTTGSLIDWPAQSRLIELVRNEDGTLSVYCTMIDSDAPLDPDEAHGLVRLASLHRELAANDPHAGSSSRLAGSPTDRTVELVLPAPFDLGP